MYVGKPVWFGAVFLILMMGPGLRPAHSQFAPPSPPAGIPGGLGGLGGLGAAPAAFPAGVPAAAPAAPRTLWSFFGLSKENLASCRQRFCASQIGQMFNSGVGSMAGAAFGLSPALCPQVPSAKDIAALEAAGGPTGPEAVAAKIKADEAGAKARVAAVEYLATVDCHYWPDAEAALIVALRQDRNECVRYAAASALGHGCCCTRKTIEALNLVVTGSEADDHPSETSERVKAASFNALQLCAMRYKEPGKPSRRSGPVEKPDATADPDLKAVANGPAGLAPRLDPRFEPAMRYYLALDDQNGAEILARARRTLALYAQRPPGSEIMATGRRSLYDAMARAANPRPSAVAVAIPEPSRAAPIRLEAAPPPPDAAVEPARYVPADTPAKTSKSTLTGERSLLGLIRSSRSPAPARGTSRK